MTFESDPIKTRRTGAARTRPSRCHRHGTIPMDTQCRDRASAYSKTNEAIMSAQQAPAESVLEAARQLAPMVRENADQIDAARELPRPVFHALADAGLYLMAVPRAVGGLEIDFPTYVQVIEELGKADASTAWTVSQGANWATYSARMSREAAREIWIDTPRSVVSNTPGATAKAVVVPGGFRVTGRQPFSTGCKHASWIAAHAQVIENGEVRQRNGKPEVRYCLVPVAQVELIDTWHTKGMRGTGTHTFEVRDVFVPEERTVSHLRRAAGEPGSALQDSAHAGIRGR